MTGRQLELGGGENPGDELEVVDATVVGEGDPGSVASIAAAAVGDALTERNLFGEAERIAARAATAATRRQYAAIYRAFGHWLPSSLTARRSWGISTLM